MYAGPYSTVSYTANGVATTFSVTFPYIAQADVTATINGQSATFTWVNSNTIQFASAPANGAVVQITRTSTINLASVTFSDGSTLRAADLNSEITQLLYGIQEAYDQTLLQVNFARSQTGQLPGVSPAQNGNLLQVTGGAWNQVTPATVVTPLVSNGLQISAGLVSVKPLNASISVAAGGVAVAPYDASLIVQPSGLQVQLADTSLVTTVGQGVSVKLNTTGGLVTSTGVKILLADTSLSTGAGGAAVNLAANGGLLVSSGVLVRGTRVVTADPGSPADGDTWYRSDIGSYHEQELGQTLAATHVLSRTVADSTTISNTSAMTAASIGVPIPANFMTVGKVIRFRITGFYNSVSTPTLQINLGLDSVSTLLDGIQFNAASTGRFVVEGTYTCRSTGSGGTLQQSTSFWVDGTAFGQGGTEAATIAFNTTAAHTIFPCFQFSAASASNNVLVRSIIVEALDP